MSAHFISGTVVGCKFEGVADCVACKRKTDDCNRGADNNCGHELVEPFNADKLDYDCDNNINKSCESCADDQTCMACGC